MTTKTLAELQNAFKTPERNSGSRGPSNYYPFHLMDFDEQCIVRFLPDKNTENPMGFLVEKVVHNLTINGNRRKVPCLSMYEDDCPICAVSQQFYKSGDEVQGKKYWKKREHIGQVLVISDPLDPDRETKETHEGKVRYINLGYQLFGIIKSAFESGDLDGIPYDFENGYNFIIKKQKQGEFATYALGSNFARKATSLDDETIAYVQEEMVDLSTLLPENPGFEKAESLLNAALTGTDVPETNTSSSRDDDDVPATPAKATKPAAAKAEVVDDSDDDDDGTTASADDVLAKIRARRQNKAAE